MHLISPDRTYDQVYISNYALINVKDELARVSGVGDVALFGQREYSMRVWLDPERIAARGMTSDEVMAALRAQNVQVAGGALGQPPTEKMGAFQTSLQLKGRLQKPDEFENIVLKSGSDGRVVRMSDVGRVELGALNYTTYGYQDKSPATVLVVLQQPGSNAIATANAIKSEMRRISSLFPQGLEYRIIYNPTEFIEISIKELYSTILEAVVLVVVVVLLFLQTWRATLIPLVAIPVSLVGTFAVMAALGYSVNMLTLFGLVLAVGIVVDDAIVVVENVERKLAEGLSPIEAARVTMDEVGTALVAIALVLSAVFIPTAFVGGITGQFYRQFAVTVASATIISAFISLTLVAGALRETAAAHAHGEQHESLLIEPVHAFFRGFNRIFDALARGYGVLARRLIAASKFMLLGLCGSHRHRDLFRHGDAYGLHPRDGPRVSDRLVAVAGGRRSRAHRCRGQVRQRRDLDDPGRRAHVRLRRPFGRYLHQRDERGRHLRHPRRRRGARPQEADRKRHRGRDPQAAGRRSRKPRPSCSFRRRFAAWVDRSASPCACRTAPILARPSSKKSRSSSSPRPTTRPASRMCSRPSRLRRRSSTSTSTATRHRC